MVGCTWCVMCGEGAVHVCRNVANYFGSHRCYLSSANGTCSVPREYGCSEWVIELNYRGNTEVGTAM